MELFTVGISVASLTVAIMVTFRERTKHRYDLLYKIYDRLQEFNRNRPELTLEEQIEREDSPDDPKWVEHDVRQHGHQESLERELELACFLAIRNQIDIGDFFYFFRGWLASREMFWASGQNAHRAHNHPYTVKMIKLCFKKNLLPISKNEELRRLRNEVEEYLR